MNERLVQYIVDSLLSLQSRSANLLEFKIENNRLLVKLEDNEDGLVGIYCIDLEFQGFAASLNDGDFRIESL